MTSALFFVFPPSVPAITIAGSTVITSIVGTAGLVALPTMAAGTLAPGTLAPGVMSTSIAAQPIMTASTALLAGKVSLVVEYCTLRCLPSCSLMPCICFACWAAYSAKIKFYSFHFVGPPAAVVTPVAATPVVTTAGLPVQPAAVQQLQLQQQQLQQQQLQQQQLVQQQQLQQQQLQQQQSAQVIAQQQAEVRAKIEEETQRKVAESSISHEENMSISGSNARYMVMQKLSRKSEVRTTVAVIITCTVGEVTFHAKACYTFALHDSILVEMCLVLLVVLIRRQFSHKELKAKFLIFVLGH